MSSLFTTDIPNTGYSVLGANQMLSRRCWPDVLYHVLQIRRALKSLPFDSLIVTHLNALCPEV